MIVREREEGEAERRSRREMNTRMNNGKGRKGTGRGRKCGGMSPWRRDRKK